MPRVISFLVLLTIVLLVGAIFFRVMAQFIVPLFLAAVLLVVFQPLHAWVLGKLPGHPRISALGTTILIVLIVLLPLTGLAWKAYGDLHAMLSHPDQTPGAAKVSEPKPPVPVVPAPDGLTTTPNATATENQDTQALVVRLRKVAKDLASGFERLTKVKLNETHVNSAISWGAGSAGKLVISGVQSVIGIVIGLVIMVISLYYFLADGPGMIRTVMDLSPLEAAYEQELLARFGQVSRAVVVATLLSAIVQGSLAGIGYYFALPTGAPIFLLTALTMVTAMIPFAGAALMWIPICGWVYLYGERIVDGEPVQGNWVAALILTIYSTCIVSGVDNIIKPLVLRGQSNLHPLVALLSILGGVQTLGPVGILVGPMLVSFLQALLEMLRKELDSFGPVEANVVQVLADGAAAAELPAAGDPGAPRVPVKAKMPAPNHRKRKK